MELADIETAVNNGKLYSIEQLAIQLALYKKGCGSVAAINAVKRLIRALTYQYNAQVIDNSTYTLYDCLVRALGGFGATYIPDPNVVIPGQTVIVNTTGVVQFTVNKTGADIDADGQIDVSGDAIPSGYKILSVYINSEPDFTEHFYSYVQDLVYGFDPDTPDNATITITFI